MINITIYPTTRVKEVIDEVFASKNPVDGTIENLFGNPSTHTAADKDVIKILKDFYSIAGKPSVTSLTQLSAGISAGSNVVGDKTVASKKLYCKKIVDFIRECGILKAAYCAGSWFEMIDSGNTTWFVYSYYVEMEPLEKNPKLLETVMRNISLNNDTPVSLDDIPFFFVSRDEYKAAISNVSAGFIKSSETSKSLSTVSGSAGSSMTQDVDVVTLQWFKENGFPDARLESTSNGFIIHAV